MTLSDFEIVEKLIVANLNLFARMNNHPNDGSRCASARKTYESEVAMLKDQLDDD